MDIDSLTLTADAEGVRVPIYAQPGASRDSVIGVFDGALKIRISAPPVEGAANERCERYLARDVLKCAKNQVSLVSGERSRHKVFRVTGLSLEEVRRRLEALPDGG